MSPANYIPLADSSWLIAILVAGVIVLLGLGIWCAPSDWDDTPETDPDASDIAELEAELRKQLEHGR